MAASTTMNAARVPVRVLQVSRTARQRCRHRLFRCRSRPKEPARIGGNSLYHCRRSQAAIGVCVGARRWLSGWEGLIGDGLNPPLAVEAEKGT